MTETTETAVQPPRYEGPVLPGRAHPQLTTVADALGAGMPTEALTILFHDLAMSGHSVPELVATAAYEATVRLPYGMSLTDQRPGCWESALFESMAPANAAMQGPRAGWNDVECPTCYSEAGEPCCTTEAEATVSVAALSDDEIPAAVLAEADLGYTADEFDPPLSIEDMRADLRESRSYAERAPHDERRTAAAQAVCYAGEWM